MNAVYLIMHQHKPDLKLLMVQLTSALKSAGIAVFAEPWLWERMGEDASSYFCEGGPENCDAILSVGGDGTLLRSNRIATEYRLPLLGINVGTVGFLAEVEWDQLSNACKRLAENDYTVQERMMLKAAIGQKQWLALNDVVLSRGGYSRLIGVNASVNGESIGLYIADGLIVSTPTGSTGYSLSAGGPIICPEVECILLTPICAHSLQHRPVIAAASQQIDLCLDSGHMHTVQVSIDGQPTVTMTAEQHMSITRADQPARLIRLNNGGFFSTIRIKLAEWSR